MAQPRIIEGDLLAQPVDVIVNPWNRNLIPWWLLLPRGVSGAIKARAGLAPFWELGGKGVLPLGGAVDTGAGRLPFKRIIHVAALHHYWVADENTVFVSTKNALGLAENLGVDSIGIPLIGAGTGGVGHERSLLTILRACEGAQLDITIVVWPIPSSHVTLREMLKSVRLPFVGAPCPATKTVNPPT